MQKILLGLIPMFMTAAISFADIPTPVAKPLTNNHSQDDERLEKMKVQSEKVRTACQPAWDTSGCKDGNNLISCVEAYKVKHPEFQFTEACKTAMQERTEMRRAAIKENLKTRKHLRPVKQTKPENNGSVPPAPITSPNPFPG